MELYDHGNDPHEWTNLASAPENKEVISKLQEALPRFQRN
jgi:hypothetical protein